MSQEAFLMTRVLRNSLVPLAGSRIPDQEPVRICLLSSSTRDSIQSPRMRFTTQNSVVLNTGVILLRQARRSLSILVPFARRYTNETSFLMEALARRAASVADR